MVKLNFVVTKILISDFLIFGLPTCDIRFHGIIKFLLTLLNIDSS